MKRRRVPWKTPLLPGSQAESRLMGASSGTSGRAFDTLLTFGLRRGPQALEATKQPKALRSCRPLGVGGGDTRGIREGSLGQGRPPDPGASSRQGGGGASCPVRRGWGVGAAGGRGSWLRGPGPSSDLLDNWVGQGSQTSHHSSHFKGNV